MGKRGRPPVRNLTPQNIKWAIESTQSMRQALIILMSRITHSESMPSYMTYGNHEQVVRVFVGLIVVD